MQGLPECHNFWPKCIFFAFGDLAQTGYIRIRWHLKGSPMISGAGRIDWTTFVDFTNLAAAGERRGWRTVCGTQILESPEFSGKRSFSLPGVTPSSE